MEEFSASENALTGLEEIGITSCSFNTCLLHSEYSSVKNNWWQDLVWSNSVCILWNHLFQTETDFATIIINSKAGKETLLSSMFTKVQKLWTKLVK